MTFCFFCMLMLECWIYRTSIKPLLFCFRPRRSVVPSRLPTCQLLHFQTWIYLYVHFADFEGRATVLVETWMLKTRSRLLPLLLASCELRTESLILRGFWQIAQSRITPRFQVTSIFSFDSVRTYVFVVNIPFSPSCDDIGHQKKGVFGGYLKWRY